MSEKRTSGPWAIFPGNYHASFVVPEMDLHKKLGGASDSEEDLTDYAQEICVIDRHHRHRSVEEQWANARLIAAAPELLAALQMAVLQNDYDMLMTGEELRQCAAAIAKATGGAA